MCIYLSLSIYVMIDISIAMGRSNLMLLPKTSPRPRSSVALGPGAEAADFAPDSDNGEERSNILLGNQS